MIKNEIAPGIVVYSDVIKNYQDFYNSLEAKILDAGLNWSAAQVKEGDVNHINTMSRDTQSIGVPHEFKFMDHRDKAIMLLKEMSNIFTTGFFPMEEDYKNFYKFNTTWHDSYSVLKYGLGQKFTNHIDDHTDFHRRMSTVYYLNDNYSGGEIVFPRFDIKYKPKANELIIFPSTYIYNHSVLPVLDGIRYAVVSWLK